MGKSKQRERNFKVNFVRAEGDAASVVADLLYANVSSVLTKHGASPTVNIREIIRNHISRDGVVRNEKNEKEEI
ncbi:hypothetical protein [Paenibacillus alvei]|uniref:hypothetical protein n=1 Tax=Paenibacillus alvei TaxID=44250 RepID=UPI001580D2C7|nr:hypothetical protein [Paenibacillus alvei]MCY7485396.1 hypothetical protein [Paenibacillus alvei]